MAVPVACLWDADGSWHLLQSIPAKCLYLKAPQHGVNKGHGPFQKVALERHYQILIKRESFQYLKAVASGRWETKITIIHTWLGEIVGNSSEPNERLSAI